MATAGIRLALVAMLGGCAPQGPTPASSIPAAPGTIDGFIPRTFRIDSTAMPYRLYVPPGYDATKRYPLVVWLHGGGGIGSDNRSQIDADQIPGTRVWTSPAHATKHPAFVLAPQSPGLWTVGHNVEYLPRVAALIDSLALEFPLDRARLYAAGQSSGGSAAWTLITYRPTLFAAAIILCPGMPLEIPTDRARIPVWIFQGELDAEGYLWNSRTIRDSVRAAGGTPRYTVYRGMGHDIWNRALTEPDLVDWLFAQHR
jgi:predicted peptidase